MGIGPHPVRAGPGPRTGSPVHGGSGRFLWPRRRTAVAAPTISPAGPRANMAARISAMGMKRPRMRRPTAMSAIDRGLTSLVFRTYTPG